MGKLNNTNTDQTYVTLLNHIKTVGVDSDDRTGVGTKSIFGVSLEFNISNNRLPIIGVRRVAARIAFEELMFMLNGKTQTKELEDKNVNIWNDNTTREFLDNRGLHHLEEGDFGRMYGAQLRDFTAINHVKYEDDSWGRLDSFDQLEYMVNEIKKNPTSRRIIASQYNPAEADQGALFPCHIMMQFNIDPKTNSIDGLFWMRSSDVGYGLPYNLMYYGFLTMMIGQLTGYKARSLVYQAGDSHLYKNQIESGMVDYMIDNFMNAVDTNAGEFNPVVSFNKAFTTLDEMLALEWSDVNIEEYEPFPDFKNKPKMAV